MANKRWGKKCSTSRNIRELKLARVHYALSKELKLERLTMASVGRMWRNRNSHALLVGTQMGTVSLHRNWAVSSLLNTGDTCRVAIHQRRTLDAGWSHSDIMEMRCELWMKSFLLEKGVQNNSRGPHPGS